MKPYKKGGINLMKQKTLLYLFLILTVLAMPLLLPHSAGAVYNPDGSTATGIAPSGWSVVDAGQCNTSINSSGIMTFSADTNTADCAANNLFPAYTTSAACTSLANSDGSHYWTSACVDNLGNGISLYGLDLNQTSCSAKATTKGGTSATYGSVCTGKWVFTGSPIGTLNSGTGGAGDGAPNAHVGFCYAKMNLGSADSCPSTTVLGYTAGTPCTYSYGISGTLSSALTAKDGVTVTAAKGTSLNMATYTTQGACLKAGGSWNTWLANPGGNTTTLADGTVIPANIYADGDVGCLHCHSYADGVGSDSGHWKESYLQTGHKNMLRAVTPGQAWYGPDGVAYGTGGADCATNPNSSDCGTVAFNWASGTVGSTTLYYIFGDWIGAEPVTPDYLISNGSGGIAGSETAYSCGNCHATGYTNAALNTDGLGIGLCNDSTKTTETTCTGTFTPGSQSGAFSGTITRTWYPMTGIQQGQSKGVLGGTGLEPANTFPGLQLSANTTTSIPEWDFNGILCSRCHSSIISATAYTIDQFGDKSSSTMGTLPSTMNGIVNVCVQCHTSLAKDYSTVTTGQTTYDPTVIPTSAASATAFAGWSGSGVDGNEYLNSPHARYVGLEQPNAVGEHELSAGGIFNTVFTGPRCNGGSTANYWTGTTYAPIMNSTECATATGSSSKWANETAPGCTSCHDVHQSVAAGLNAPKPFNNECLDCHNDGMQSLANSNHPDGPGTPYGIAEGLGAGGGTIGTQFSVNNTDGSTACVICHMPEINAGAVETHVFRINPSATYSTFPTTASLNGGSCSTDVSAATSANCAGTYHGTWELYNGGTCVITSSANCSLAGGTWAAQTKNVTANTSPETYYTSLTGTPITYNPAVWSDVDLACGQCHGGSQGASMVNNGAPYYSKTQLAGYAANMHNTSPIVQFTGQMASNKLNNGAVNFDASATVCPSGNCEYNWSFGDGTTLSTGSNLMPSHTYPPTAGSTPYPVLLTVVSATSSSVPNNVTNAGKGAPFTFNTLSSTVTVNIQPTVNETESASNLTVTLTDNSTAGSSISINWGDGSTASTGSAGGIFTHTYSSANTYTIVASATLQGLVASQNITAIVPAKYTVGGTVTNLAGTTPLSGVSLQLKLNGVAKAAASTSSTGAYTFVNVVPGAYTITAVKSGYTFASPAANVTVTTGPVTAVNFTSSN